MNKENLEIITSAGGRDGRLILELKGRLTIETVIVLQDTIRRENAPELIIDMSGVLFMDSAGLGVMIAAYVRAKKTSGKLALAGSGSQDQKTLRPSHQPHFPMDGFSLLNDFGNLPFSS